MRTHTTHARDAALRKLRRLNRWMIAGSIALTGVLADVAANAFPGKTIKVEYELVLEQHATKTVAAVIRRGERTNLSETLPLITEAGMVEFEDPETQEKVVVDATSYRHDYQSEIEGFRALYKQECFQTGVDYVPLDTSLQFDKALLEYLVSRQNRG